jgi:hypothetical protein
MIFAKPLKEIVEQDIQNLVDDQIEESAHLDYKREVDFSSSGKKELAKDISAFANSGGGVILYGIEEKKNEHGIPVPVSPIHGIESSIDRERIENVALNSISPRVQMSIRRIELSRDPSRSVLILFMPASLQAPHMLTKGGDNRYYKRVNFSSVPMEEYEVRLLFQKNIQMREEASRIEQSKDNCLRDLNNDGSPWLCMLSYPEIIAGDLFSINDRTLDWLRDSIHHTMDESRYLAGFLRPLGSGFVARYEENHRIWYILEVRKDGVLEWGNSSLFINDEKSKGPTFLPYVFAKELIGFLDFLGEFYEKWDYFGSVRLVIGFNNMQDYSVRDRTTFISIPRFPNPILRICREFLPANLTEDRQEYTQSIMNELFNELGKMSCPYFDDKGHLKNVF